MRIPNPHPILRSTAFRAAAAVAAALGGCIVLLFAFIYWQTASFETARVDRFLVNQIGLIADAPPPEVLWMVRTHIATDLHRVTFAALFDMDDRLVAGNVARMPADLPADGRTHWVRMLALADAEPHPARVIAVARRLPDGRTLVLGRDIEEITNLRHLVAHALELGVIPAMLLALAAGAWAGHLASRRIRVWQRILNRVRDGHLTERLPVRGRGGDVDRLAGSVNTMLDELERLIGDLHNVGNNISHDLRTPLARVRTQLERTRRMPHSPEDLDRVIEQMIAWLDQSISITTSVLRIAEIEGNRRRDAFGPTDLAEIAREVADFYEPAAEQRKVAVRVALQPCPKLRADRDLLFEAIANLVDNAIKFTPDGGAVAIEVGNGPAGPWVRVSDSGPGIPLGLRQAVFKRFFRLDPKRGPPGIGLGLSLVAAIAKLHGYELAIEDGDPGCVVVLTCAAADPPDAGPPLRYLVNASR